MGLSHPRMSPDSNGSIKRNVSHVSLSYIKSVLLKIEKKSILGFNNGNVHCALVF
jgi:hypothetical protein